MNFFDIVLIALALSADAFAASVCKGLASGRAKRSQALTAAAWFGGFQALMPILGKLLGSTVSGVLQSWGKLVAGFILAVIGAVMIKEALSKEEPAEPSFSWKVMLPAAVATSIDALATGLTFGVLGVNALLPSLLIGCITAALSYIGVTVGGSIGGRQRRPAQLAGGAILIILAVKTAFFG